ncbi:MAG: thiosulfate oxidation carrier protein SoxY [Methylococcales bacterium]|nr:thiosulfate oxidation carrier protein SoxY [Methylococcales bacterium]
MPSTRRAFIKQSLASSVYASIISSGLLTTTDLQAAWIPENFSPATLTDTLTKMYHNADMTDSEAITLKVPRVAENGAVVPVTVSSSLPNVSEITLFVAKNPTPLSVIFKLSPTMEAFVSARIKMAETCNVIAVVNSDGKLYKTHQEITVTIGGCGG